MRLIGLTGGIGAGKSTTSELLLRRGIALADTDRIAHQLVEPGQSALSEIIQKFGREFIDPTGQLHRAALGRRVFSNPTDRKELEAILHPRIREAWQTEVNRWRAENRSLGVVVIPLLFETSAAANFDATICVACTAPTQWDRLRARGWDDDQIRGRLTAQWPTEKKMGASNFVLWTEAGMDVHEAQLDRILASV